jgi:uncharacterized protein
MTPPGKFYLDQTSTRALVLLSGGVGLTPMIAITEHIVAEGKRAGRSARSTSFMGRRMVRSTPLLNTSSTGGAASRDDRARSLQSSHRRRQIGITYDGDGHVTIDLVRSLLSFGDYDFYLCGPPPFMTALYTGLLTMGSPAWAHSLRILRSRHGTQGQYPTPSCRDQWLCRWRRSAVRFARSALDAAWSGKKGTLLELAEAAGLAAAFGCRSGICSSCIRPRSVAVRWIISKSHSLLAGPTKSCCVVRCPGKRADAATVTNPT